MKIKVCGMREPKNMEALAELQPDLMGMIFYPKSKRYLTKVINEKVAKGIKRVGVFVNANKAEILKIAYAQQLDYIQLHGEESPEFCALIKAENLKVVKAFAVNDDFDFNLTKVYEPHCEYFLFDTKGKNPGGNGVVFNWDILRKYKGHTPFLLAGGIGPEHLTEVKKIKHEKMWGVDLNSKFEISPGLKNITTLKKFINDLRC